MVFVRTGDGLVMGSERLEDWLCLALVALGFGYKDV